MFQPKHVPSICTTAPESPSGGGGEDVTIPIPRLRPSMITLQELEAQEEEEDRVLLGNMGSLENSAVHFRSRLSLIPEQHSVIDEDGEQTTPESASGSEASSRRCNVKRSIPLTAQDVAGHSKPDEKQSSKPHHPLPTSASASASTSTGIANKISNFLVRRKSNASNS